MAITCASWTSVADDIDHFEEDGAALKENGLLEADIVIRCTGFERNAQLIPKLTPYTQVNSCNYLDRDCMYLADALIDASVFNSVFGSSVLEMARVFCSVYLYFWKNPADYELVRPHLVKTPVEQRKWSDYIASLDLICAELPGVRELAVRRVTKRRSDFLRAHNVEEYLRENRREWNELHSILGIWSEETAFPPLPALERPGAEFSLIRSALPLTAWHASGFRSSPGPSVASRLR